VPSCRESRDEDEGQGFQQDSNSFISAIWFFHPVNKWAFDAFVHMNDRRRLYQKFWDAASIQKIADEYILLSRRMAEFPFGSEPIDSLVDAVLLKHGDSW
jgi:hypothetical protein